MQNNKILKSFKNLVNYNVKFGNENEKKVNWLFLTHKLLAQQQELVKFYSIGSYQEVSRILHIFIDISLQSLFGSQKSYEKQR
jgi:hypothetical protein